MCGDFNVDFRDDGNNKCATDLYNLLNEFSLQPTIFDVTCPGTVKLGSYIKCYN